MSGEPLYVDVCGLRCPLLFVTVKLWLKKLQAGQQLVVTIDDKTGLKDVVSYLQKHDFKFTLTPQAHLPVKMTITSKDT